MVDRVLTRWWRIAATYSVQLSEAEEDQLRRDRSGDFAGLLEQTGDGSFRRLADYLITWVDYAPEQYLALDQPITAQLDRHPHLLADQPKNDAHYEPSTDRWTVELDAGQGLVVYVVNDQHRRVVILRILHLG